LTRRRAFGRWPDALGFDYFRGFPGGERDYKSLLDAVASGRITAEPDLQDPGRRCPDG
jgi:hypothetical protein